MSALNTAAQLIYVLSPMLGYAPQIFKKKILFSPLLSFMVVLSSMFRLIHCKIDKLEYMYSFQALLAITVHTTLIYMYKDELSNYEHNFFRVGYYYRTKGVFYSYLQLFSTALMSLLLVNYFSSELLLSLCITGNILLESSVGLAQLLLYKFDKKSNKRPLPKELFFFWVVGDICKTVLLIYTQAKKEIILSVVFQLVVNTMLLSAKI
ncbi:putative transporter [Tubulinosema ratisbonensis]|uniref:Putative transporter n=1 Tax=Tubulinosema ratisbonensis TaxID=291195 RepID=A0A437AIF7_9MICR|nr:putative transporter [Tubulinosema ratisbonensis]